jgi:hypothetical protein
MISSDGLDHGLSFSTDRLAHIIMYSTPLIPSSDVRPLLFQIEIIAEKTQVCGIHRKLHLYPNFLHYTAIMKWRRKQRISW